jgi:hypothetical protein
MYTSDAVISFLPPTETIATANEIVKRLGRLNEDVSATDVFTTYDALQRERRESERAEQDANVATLRREGPRELAGARSCRGQVQHIIDNIAADSFTTVTLPRGKKPILWLHRDRYYGDRVIVQDRKGVLTQSSAAQGQPGREYVADLLGRHLAEGARVDQGVRF